MYLRTVRAQGGKGTQHEYIRLVEAYREDGKNKQRVVCNLGRKDLLGAHLDSLIRLLQGQGESQYVRVGDVEASQAPAWGPMLAISTLFRDLGLEAILDRRCPMGRDRSLDFSFTDRALVLLANRLCAPSSEHRLARWLERDFVCDRHGERFLPRWREDSERLSSRSPRVRVAFAELAKWYRTLDWLVSQKELVEQELYLRLRDLFSLEVDLVFYDLTSTYFEGHGPPNLARHGHSRDKRPRDPQVLVGVVMVGGWPIAHHVFAGNRKDEKTVPQVLEDLEKRFGLGRIVFVGDRGMVTKQNVDLLRSKGQGYVVGLNRRRREEVYRYIKSATGPWIECPVGILASEKQNPPKTEVCEAASQKPGVRVFVVKSEERLDYEQKERLKAMERVRVKLESLERRIAKGRLKSPEKVGAAATRALSRYHGYRYFNWEYKAGRFRFFEHPVNLPREQTYEGTYVIQTEEKNITPLDAVRIYKELSDVERAFRNLKDVIQLRPIYHHTDHRVEAHIFIAALAFLIHRTIEKKLKAAGLDLSATEALEALRCVRVVDFQLGEGRTKRSVTRRSTARAARILAALGITRLDPPTPSQKKPKTAL